MVQKIRSGDFELRESKFACFVGLLVSKIENQIQKTLLGRSYKDSLKEIFSQCVQSDLPHRICSSAKIPQSMFILSAIGFLWFLFFFS